MTDSFQTHYLNTDFDVSLRPRPGQLHRAALVRQVRELSVQAVLGARAGDSVLVRADLPGEFLEHLDSCGLPVPRLAPHPEIDLDSRLRPFGWNAETIELNRGLRQPAEHPPLSVVRRVNSRSFACELQRELAPDDPPSSTVESEAELDAFLSRAPADSAWVIKAEHGNAGLGNRRLRHACLDTTDRRFVHQRLAEDDRLIVEPWMNRERDWCVVFGAPFSAEALRVHETVCTRDGSLIGALFDPRGTEAVTQELGMVAEQVAARLGREGYFGPVCLDAFHWRDGDRTGLRALVDLNCRLSMSDSAYRLWRHLGREQTLYYRFFNRRKLRLPAGLPELLLALGKRRYDRDRRQGILLASPLQLGSSGLPGPEGLLADAAWRPGKLAVIFAAASRSGVFELEGWFRERFKAGPA